MIDCGVCGKGFNTNEEYKNHVEQAHEAMNDTYSEAFCKANEETTAWDLQVCRKCGNSRVLQEDTGYCAQCSKKLESREVNWRDIGDKKVIDKGSHYETEDGTLVDWSSYDATDAQKYLSKKVNESKANEDDMDDLQYKQQFGHDWRDDKAKSKKKEKEGDEGGARGLSSQEQPLKKVDSLSESWGVLEKEKKAQLFESLGINQGSAYTLADLDWFNLSPQLKADASEAYAKEEDELVIDNDEDLFALHKGLMDKPIKDDKEKEVNEAYADIYNIEKNHLSPDYKKKAIECSRCNEKFYNSKERDVHFNEFHATEQEYNLPEECPFCKELIKEPETLDYHMQQEHGAHVPSQYTQTGIQGAMADTDFDSLGSDFYSEAFDSDWACPRCGNKKVTIKKDENGNPIGRACPKCGLGNEVKATESKWRVNTITHGKVNVNLGKDANEEDALNAVKRMYFDDGYIDDSDILSANKLSDEAINFGKHQTCSICGQDFELSGVSADSGWGSHDTEGNRIVRNDRLNQIAHYDCVEASGEDMSPLGESYANEEHTHNWEQVGDADGDRTFECTGCPAKLWAHPGQSKEEGDIYYGYLGQESKTNEANWTDFGHVSDPNFRTNCTDGEPHVPKEDKQNDICIKCGKNIRETGEGSGYWFTDEDNRNWNRTYNESKATEWSTGISSKDPTAITQLEAKLARLEEEKTEIKARPIVPRDWSFSPEDSRGFELTNINANIRSVKQRIEDLKNRAGEAKIPSGDLYQHGQKVGTITDYNPKKHEGYVTLDGIGIKEFGAMTSDYEVRVNGERIPNKWDGKHDYNLDLFGEAYNDDMVLRALDTPDANNEGLPIHAQGVYWRCDLCDYKTYFMGTFDNADPIKPHLKEEHGIGESYAKEDGGYANFGDKPKEESWSVLTVGSDLWYFNSEQEARDYVKNFPKGTYQINRPREGRESYAKEISGQFTRQCPHCEKLINVDKLNDHIKKEHNEITEGLEDPEYRVKLFKDIEKKQKEDKEESNEDDDHPKGWDKRKPDIGGYDPELDVDDPPRRRDKRQPEIGGYDPELDYDG